MELVMLMVGFARATEPAPTPEGGNPNPMGLVVRFSAGSGPVETPVVVHLAPEGAAAMDLQLRDDGQAPDVSAGDATWSASGVLPADAVVVSLSLGATRLDGGKVAWTTGAAMRDLNVSLVNGALHAEAGSGTPALAAPPPTSPSVSATVADAPISVDRASTRSTRAAAPPPSPSGDSPWVNYGVVIALGAGIVGLGYTWFRAGVSLPSLPHGVVRAPEPGLAGPGTPSLSDGRSVWAAPLKDRVRLLRVLLASMARHHAVVVGAPPVMPLPPVAGGAVYRVDSADPAALAEVVDALVERGARDVAVLLVTDGLDAATLVNRMDSLPRLGGVVVLTSEGASGLDPTVRCRWEEGLWVLEGPSGTVRVREGAAGFEPEPPTA